MTRRWAARFHPPVHLRGLLFDYGGTLDGAASHWLDRFATLYREAGVAVPFDRLKAAFYRADAAAYGEPRAAQMSLRELMDFHVAVQLQVLDIHEPGLHRTVAAAFVARSEAALADSRTVLERLAPTYRLGVVSNFYGNIARILADAGIAPLLAVVADSTVVGTMKPDRRIFDYALAGLGTRAEETLHVGDSYERDVCAAKSAGLCAAWLVPPGRAPTIAASENVADLQVGDLHELAAMLEGTASGERGGGPTGFRSSRP